MCDRENKTAPIGPSSVLAGGQEDRSGTVAVRTVMTRVEVAGPWITQQQTSASTTLCPCPEMPTGPSSHGCSCGLKLCWEQSRRERPTFLVDGQWDAVDGLEFDTRVGQHLQLHRCQGEAFETCRRGTRCTTARLTATRASWDTQQVSPTTKYQPVAEGGVPTGRLGSRAGGSLG